MIAGAGMGCDGGDVEMKVAEAVAQYLAGFYAACFYSKLYTAEVSDINIVMAFWQAPEAAPDAAGRTF